MLKRYNSHISKFEEKYLEHYEDISAEEIQSWDKIMLVAKNIQDEDPDYASGNVISSYLISKYTKNQLL